jgi:hypothetical protein
VLTRVGALRRKLYYKINGLIVASVAESVPAILPIGSHIVYMSTYSEGSWFHLM